MQWKRFVPLLFLLLLLRSQAQAQFLWYFDDPLKYQSMTLSIMVDDPSKGIDRFVGQTLRFIPHNDKIPPVTLTITAADKNNNVQIRKLLPRIAVAEYKMELTGMAADETLVPPEIRVHAKSYQLDFLCRTVKTPEQLKAEKAEKSEKSEKSEKAKGKH